MKLLTIHKNKGRIWSSIYADKIAPQYFTVHVRGYPEGAVQEHTDMTNSISSKPASKLFPA